MDFSELAQGAHCKSSSLGQVAIKTRLQASNTKKPVTRTCNRDTYSVNACFRMATTAERRLNREDMRAHTHTHTHSETLSNVRTHRAAASTGIHCIAYLRRRSRRKPGRHTCHTHIHPHISNRSHGTMYPAPSHMERVNGNAHHLAYCQRALFATDMGM